MAGRSPRRRAFGLVPVLVAVAMLASACNYLDWGPGGPERPWWCDPTDTEINDGHGDGHGGHQHYTEDKGPLSASQCLIVDRGPGSMPPEGFLGDQRPLARPRDALLRPGLNDHR